MKGLAIRIAAFAAVAIGVVYVVRADVTGSVTPLGGNGGGGSGTVQSVAVANANGLSGTVTNPTTTPSISLSTSISGPLKGSSGAVTAATASDISALFGGATGTGLNVLQTSPTFVTPALGTPSALVLTNATGLPATALPALTGDCTTATGTAATTCTKTSGTAFGTFATQNYATPPAIGSTAPAAGSFTTLGATGTFTSTNAAGYTVSNTSGSLASGTTGFGENFVGTVNDASAVDGIISFANITCTLCTATSYLADWQVGGTSEFKVATNGNLTTNGSVTSASNVTVGSAFNLTFGSRNSIASPGGNQIQLGGNNGSTTANPQTLSAQGVSSGNLNVGGGNLILQSGQGTGSATASTITLVVPVAGTSSTTQQTLYTEETLAATGISFGETTNKPTISFAGHLVSNSTNVTSSALSGCGTSPSINATATDSKGTITEGTTSTGCTLTFLQAYSTAPDCVISSPTGNTATSYTTSTTTLVIVNASASGDKFTYHCIQ